MGTVKNHTINLNVTTSTLRDYLSICIKTIISRRGIYPTGAFVCPDSSGMVPSVSQDFQTANYIETLVSKVQDAIKQKKKTTVVITIRTHDLKAIDNWFIKINMLYFTDASTANYAPKLIDYLIQIVMAASFFPALKPPFILQQSVWVEYDNT